MSEGITSQSIPPSKTWHGPPPPIELTTNASSLELLSQGAEARVWLVTMPEPTKSNQNNEITNDSGGGGHRMRTIHVGSGINVPQLLTLSQQPSPLIPQTTPAIMDTSPSSQSSSPSPPSLKIICKERFPKKYRHPALDASLTKSRTKGEARSLIRCQRADVPCTNVLAIAHLPSSSSSSSSSSDNNDTAMTNNSNPGGKNESKNNNNNNNNGATYVTSTTSSCLFLEYVEGCTVRQYIERRSGEQPADGKKTGGDAGPPAEPAIKRPRCETPASTASSSTSAAATAGTTTESKDEFRPQDSVTTVIDSRTLLVAHTIGTLVAQMHNAGVIHGDLTTSNIMIRNPPWLCGGDGDDCTGTGNNATETSSSWKPQLVLIDFGLATSTASSKTSNNNASSSSSSGNKKAKPHKQQHNAEEKAVDLYVLERAFLSTHPESEPLVEEVWKGYRGCFENLDGDCRNDGDGVAGAAGGGAGQEGGEEESDRGYLAKSVLNRLEQVRMRGRKRECFG